MTLSKLKRVWTVADAQANLPEVLTIGASHCHRLRPEALPRWI